MILTIQELILLDNSPVVTPILKSQIVRRAIEYIGSADLDERIALNLFTKLEVSKLVKTLDGLHFKRTISGSEVRWNNICRYKKLIGGMNY